MELNQMLIDLTEVYGFYNVDRTVKLKAFATEPNTTIVVLYKIQYIPHSHS
jgi:uncharacterized protein (DUF2132 family)